MIHTMLAIYYALIMHPQPVRIVLHYPYTEEYQLSAYVITITSYDRQLQTHLPMS